MKPAPASSTSVSAISATMSALVQRRARGPPVPLRPPPPSFITSLTSVFDTCSAGARPNSTPVARQIGAEEDEDDRIHRERHPVRLADVGRDLRIEPRDAEDRQPEPEHAADRPTAAGSRPAAAGRSASGSRRATRGRRSRATGSWRGRAADWRRWRRRSAARRPTAPISDEEDQPELRARDPLVEGDDVRLDSPCWCRGSRGRAARDRVWISARACASVTPSPSRPITWKLRTLRLDWRSSGGELRDRHPELVVERELHVRRHHADHRRGEAVDA